MVRRYITAKEFSEFSKNQSELINILNHSLTKLTVDVSWLKKLVSWQIGLLGAITVAVVTTFIKLVVI